MSGQWNYGVVQQQPEAAYGGGAQQYAAQQQQQYMAQQQYAAQQQYMAAAQEQAQLAQQAQLARSGGYGGYGYVNGMVPIAEPRAGGRKLPAALRARAAAVTALYRRVKSHGAHGTSFRQVLVGTKGKKTHQIAAMRTLRHKH